jgi:hypothetical protein
MRWSAQLRAAIQKRVRRASAIAKSSLDDPHAIAATARKS